MTGGDRSDDHLTTAESALAAELKGNRPVPAAGFRGALGRRLAAGDPGYGPRPEHLRLSVLACLAAGVLLLAIAALLATGMP